MDATTATDTAPEGATATAAAAAPPSNMDPHFILTLARDNKAAELLALVQQGYPVNAGNKVGVDRLDFGPNWATSGAH
jgi:hypothetical protein